jgi:flagellar protein FlgJ
VSASPLAFDGRALQGLQARAAADPRGAVREAARQLEALFMQELVKSMRATTLGGPGDGQGELATGMLDSQLATQMAGLPGGLTDVITRQLERQMGLAPGPIPAPSAADPAPASLAPLAALDARPTRIPQKGAAAFVEQHQGAARAAEAATGIPAEFMVSQAALETGWGRKEIRHADGSPSYNLFGIKAGADWRGPVAEIATTEYQGGQARKVVARFRAYGGYAESFADYARLMKTSPRYQSVLAGARSADAAEARAGAFAHGLQRAGAFAHGLQRAGYATDPAYAEKLSRVINTTLRLQRTLQA